MSGFIVLVYVAIGCIWGISMGMLTLFIQKKYAISFISRFKIIYSMILISFVLLYIFEPTFPSLLNDLINEGKNINIFILLAGLISYWMTLIILELISIFLVKSISIVKYIN